MGLLTSLKSAFGPRPAKGDPPVVLFDGVCGLYNQTVDFLIKADRTNFFRFAPLQGETAAKIVGELPEKREHWSIILVDENGMHERSDASLRIFSRLGGIFRLCELLLWIPR